MKSAIDVARGSAGVIFGAEQLDSDMMFSVWFMSTKLLQIEEISKQRGGGWLLREQKTLYLRL